MLRRFLTALTLAFSLLIAQQGAVWHALSHAQTSTPEHQGKQVPADKCGQCIAYAHIGTALASSLPIVVADTIISAQVARLPHAFTPATQFHFLSRGPPRLV